VNGVKSDSKILFMSDTKSFFSKNHGWDAGMGDRNGRWAMIIEKDGTVSAADVEKSPREVTVSDLVAQSRSWSTDNVYRSLARTLSCRRCSAVWCILACNARTIDDIDSVDSCLLAALIDASFVSACHPNHFFRCSRNKSSRMNTGVKRE
jgi:hypothetical protein